MDWWPADKVERWPIERLIPYARNARVHSDEQIAQVAASIREWGWTNPVLVSEDGGIIAGHCRVLAGRQLGLTEVPIMLAIGWTEAQKRAYLLADNQLTLNANWNPELLRLELGELQELKFDLGLIGFDDAQLAALTANPGLTDPDEVPEPPVEPIAKLGDVWQLGRHRLVCGDATKAEDVTRALGKERSDLCLTDPPYGIKLDYGGVFDDTIENVRAIANKWLPLIREHSDVVVFSPGVTRQWIYPEPDWVLCWFYGGGQLRSPWGFNCWQPFLCYGKDPSLKVGQGARPDAVDMNTPANAAEIGHPCPKPMKLWHWLIDRLSMRATDMIFDPFIGSGTTIIAAEMTGRKCSALELSPTYCDVTIERWQNFTGEKAKRL